MAASAGVVPTARHTEGAEGTSGARRKAATAGVPVPRQQRNRISRSRAVKSTALETSHLKRERTLDCSITASRRSTRSSTRIQLRVPNTPACRANVIRAVSTNEGRIEAINTYDDSVSVSVGVSVDRWLHLPPAKGCLVCWRCSERDAPDLSTYFGSVGLAILVPTAKRAALNRPGCWPQPLREDGAMDSNRSSKKFSPEVRERAVPDGPRPSRASTPRKWAAMVSIGAKIGCNAETLCHWVRRAERDAGNKTWPDERRARRATEGAGAREPRAAQANEIRAASAYFAMAELDRRSKT